MSKRRRKPGRLYWLSTFAVGIWSPDKGQRRVNSEMQAKDERIGQLEAENHILREANGNLVAERNYYIAQAEISEGLLEATKVKIAAKGADDTLPIAKVYTSWGTTDPAVTKAHVKTPANSTDQSAKAS